MAALLCLTIGWGRGNTLAFDQAPAMAQWTIYKQAQARNAEGHLLRIDCTANGTVRAWVILDKAQQGVFNKKPLYQIDDHPACDLEGAPGMRTDLGASRWVQWRLCDPQDQRCAALQAILEGHTMVFQYYPAGGEIRETMFQLSGVEAAIERILN